MGRGLKRAKALARKFSNGLGRAGVEALESRVLLSAAMPVINEFVANNKTGLTDAAGDHPDWIEIYNPAASAVNLASWTITEKDSNNAQAIFTFPTTNSAVTIVAAGGYKIIYCDTKSNSINSSSEIHANFNIDKDGGSLILAEPDGTVTTAFDPYPAQITDVSYGPGPATVATTGVISTPAATEVKVPADSSLGTTWTQPTFDDSSWTKGTTGVGYENLSGGSNPAALPTETEPDDTPAQADDATTNFVAQSSSNVYQIGVKGTLSSATDDDYFKIGALQAGDVLSVSMSGSPSSRGTETDSYLELYRGSDPNNLTLVTTNDDGGVGADSTIDRLAIGSNDTYYIKAHSSNHATAGTYDLAVYLENAGSTPAPTTGGTVVAEAEPNNTGATATDLSSSWRQVNYLSHTTGSTSASTSIDYYKYTFTAGDLVTINADSTGSQRMKVSLYNSSGTTLLALEDGTSDRTAPYNLDSTLYSFIIPASGTYYVKATATAGGAYAMDVYLSTHTTPPVPGGQTALYTGLINTNVGAAMQNVNASIYVRVPFTIIDPTQVQTLVLNMKYDDGFVAYLNGTEVARSNAGGTAGAPPAYNAAAPTDRTDSLATTAVSFDLSAYENLLQEGNNVLAIQALNFSPADTRFLVSPELSYTTTIPAQLQYMATPTPGAANVGGSLGSVKDTNFSQKRGFYEAPFDVAITSNTSGATIKYTTDGSAPTATHGTTYSGPIHIAATTTLRAAAFKPGYIGTDVDTETYLFLATVQNQTVPSASYPASSYPATWAGDQQIGGGGVPSGTYPADYNINTAISQPTGQTWTNADFRAGLTQIPTISIVTDPSLLFATPVLNAAKTDVISGGIYQLPQEEGDAWEEPASVEYIGTDGTSEFQENVGLRTQGAAARQNSKQPKHSLRILFKSEYGDSNLNFPFFGPGTEGIDSIDFRATYNNSWTHTADSSATDAQRNQADYVRDGWNRETQAAMGDLGLPSKFVNLYINGLYWGVYDATDRPEASYYASALGGSADDYEVLNAGTVVDSPPSAPNAAATDWATLNSQIDAMTTVNGQSVLNVSTAAGYAQIKNLLDVQNLADYIIQMLYAGNEDWDGGGHNWYTYRDAAKPGDGFKFIAWDSERTLEGTNDNVTGVNNVGAPSHLFHQLMSNADFKTLVADRLHKFLFNNGALTPAASAARYSAMSSQISEAIVDESARWGNYDSAYRNIGTQVFTKNNWTASVNTILNSYFPVRTANVLAQFKALGWYPTTDAPEYSQFGGQVGSGFALTINNSTANVNAGGGVIYYTLDGSDPRLAGGAVSPTALVYNAASRPTLTQGADVQARVLLNGVWSALTDATFFVGAAPALRITEVMYHPQAPTGSTYADDDFGFIEFQNTGTTSIPLQGFLLSGGVSFTFPKGLPDLQPGQYIVAVSNPTAFQALYGTSVNVAGTYVGALSHSADEIKLSTPLGQEVEDFTYQDTWYPVTDGNGYSLIAVDPNATDAALNTAAGWRPSTSIDGEPGAADPGVNAGSLVINEVLSNSTGTSTGDWVELANTTSAPIDASNWYLSDDSANLKKYQIPAGTIVPAGGFVTFTQAANFGSAFTLNDAGGSIYLTQGDAAGDIGGYRDEEDFGAADPGVTHGRYVTSTGSVDFPQLAAATFGAANAGPRVAPVIINELMYDPAGTGDEYVEIKNVTNASVNLFDPANPADTWQFTDGINFTFPTGVTLSAGALALVVPIDPATFRSKYNVPAGVQIFGPYIGALNNAGENVKLSKPGTPIAGVTPYVTVDRVNYNHTGAWPAAPFGQGPSLERASAFSYGDDPASWIASAAGGTPGAANVADAAPTINAMSAVTARVGAGFSAAGSFTDPDATDSWIATVDYGDGTGPHALALSGKTFTLSNAYAATGSYTATITIADGQAAYATLSVPITVTDPVGLTPAAGAHYTLTGAAGAQVLEVTTGSIALAADLSMTYPGLSLLVDGGATATIAGVEHFNGVTVQAGGAIAANATYAPTLVTSSLSLAGTLDLGGGYLAVTYAAGQGATAFAALNALLLAGRAGGAWNGPAITSSQAAASVGTTSLAGVGIMNNDNGSDSPLHATFGSATALPASAILLRYTYLGDADLSGTVDSTDFAALQASFGSTGRWSNGDFDFNGSVNFNDFMTLQNNFNKSIPAPVAPQAAPVVTRPSVPPSRSTIEPIVPIVSTPARPVVRVAPEEVAVATKALATPMQAAVAFAPASTARRADTLKVQVANKLFATETHATPPGREKTLAGTFVPGRGIVMNNLDWTAFGRRKATHTNSLLD